jgi:hypothetical protein
MEITSCPDNGSLNFEFVPRFLENLYTPGLFIYLFYLFILFYFSLYLNTQLLREYIAPYKRAE